MTPKKYQLFVVVFTILCLIVTIVGLYSLHNRQDKQPLISAVISVGVENITHTNFINRIIKNTNFESKDRVRIFLGPYQSILGLDGFILNDSLDYYILIDWGFYFSLEEGEKEALIAHELGHKIYRPSLIENIQLDIIHELRGYIDLKTRHNQITTKYQTKADTFAAEKTSPEKVISVLNKIRIDRSGYDYKTRMESLNKLKQGQID